MTDLFISGIGLLSKLPIQDQTTFNLVYRQGPDRNHRLVLHARIDQNGMGILNVLVTHLSYDRHQQCGNTADIINYIEGKY